LNFAPAPAEYGTDQAAPSLKPSNPSACFRFAICAMSYHKSVAAPIPGFPDLKKEYRSGRLWPFFAERIPDQRRPEIQEVILREGLTSATTLQLLASLGAHSVTDPFELRLSQAA
jgi:hypothetical protein